jgi:hypothetical protein
MSWVVGSNNSYKPITNTVWVRAQLCKLQKGCTRLAAASDKVYQLLAHGRWFSPGTPACSTTKTGRHDIAEILLKVALNTKIQNSKSLFYYIATSMYSCTLSACSSHISHQQLLSCTHHSHSQVTYRTFSGKYIFVYISCRFYSQDILVLGHIAKHVSFEIYQTVIV